MLKCKGNLSAYILLAVFVLGKNNIVSEIFACLCQ
jgi:hypothetical protein